MAFEGNYDLSQSSESTITLTDTSTGTDANLTSRRIYLIKWDNTYLVPEGTTTDYIEWNISDSSITLENILDKDYALNVRVDWISSDPDPDGVYTVTKQYEFKWYGELFAAFLTSEAQARYPAIVNNKNYFYNKIKLRVLLDDAEQSVSFMLDTYKAQFCNYQVKQLIDNQSVFF